MMNEITEVPKLDFDGYYKEFTFDVIDVMDKSYNVKLLISCRNSERFGAKGNVFYIDGTPSPHELSPYHKFYHKELKAGPMWIDLELDKKWKKYNRNEVKIFNMFIDRFMDYLSKMGYQYRDLEYYILCAGLNNRKWNMHAGCSMCKCSPGFKMKGNHITNHSFSLTFTEIKPQP